jgi:hypothetical protein
MFSTLYFLSEKRGVYTASNAAPPSPSSRSQYTVLPTREIKPFELLTVRDLEGTRSLESLPVVIGELISNVTGECVGFLFFSDWHKNNFYTSLMYLNSASLDFQPEELTLDNFPSLFRCPDFCVYSYPSKLTMIFTGEVDPDLQDYLKL